jgi:hypothetical protein
VGLGGGEGGAGEGRESDIRGKEGGREGGKGCAQMMEGGKIRRSIPSWSYTSHLCVSWNMARGLCTVFMQGASANQHTLPCPLTNDHHSCKCIYLCEVHKTKSDLWELVTGFVMYMESATEPISAGKCACYARALVHFCMSTARCKCVHVGQGPWGILGLSIELQHVLGGGGLQATSCGMWVTWTPRSLARQFTRILVCKK